MNAFLGRNKIKLKWIYTRYTIAFTDKDKDKDNQKTMATKKITRDNKSVCTGMRCGNCDAICLGTLCTEISEMTMGRQSDTKKIIHYCTEACLNKGRRDLQRPIFEQSNLADEMKVDYLKVKYLPRVVEQGRTSKSCFLAIKMLRQGNKVKTMMMSMEYPMHIIKVELFKWKEVAMEYAELVAEDEDPVLNHVTANMVGLYTLTQIGAYDEAMWADKMIEDKGGCLSFWFN